MARFYCCGAVAVAALFLFACAGFDGHVDTLPPEIEVALTQRAKETPEQREKINQDETEIVVGTITILNQTVLPASDFFAPLLNNVHFVTQKDVIYDELNFKEGDKIPRWKLYDAERYVRMLSPIKQAQIVETKNPKTGKSDLTVVTQDRLTAQVQSGASGSGGYSSFGLRVIETNLFGRLYAISGNYSRENFRDFVSLGAGKARIGGSRWQVGSSTTMGFAHSRYNYFAQSVIVEHPFTRDGQRHAFSVQTDFDNGIKYEYFGGGIRKAYDAEAGKSFDMIYHRRTQSVSAQYLYGIGKNDRIEFGPGFWHYIRRDYYVNPEDQYTLSSPRELAVSASARSYYQAQQYSTNALVLAVNTRNGNFVPMKNFQRYLFTEDQFEGFRTSGKIIHANPAFGLTDHYTAPAMTFSYQKNFFDQKVRLESSVTRTATFWHSGINLPSDDLSSGELKGFYFTRFGTIALKQYLAFGNHLTADRKGEIGGQFTRGFYYGSIFPSAGTLSSIEYRSPGWKLPYLLVAGVLFIDYAGIGEKMSSLSYHPIVGFGFRSMLYEFDNNVFRIDFGFNLNESELRFLNALQFGLNHSF